MDNDSIALASKIALPQKKGVVLIEIDKIIRCMSDNSYTEFLILDDSGRENLYLKKVVTKGIFHFEETLVSTGIFFRIHNQYIINVNFLKEIGKSNGGYVMMNDNTGEMIPIARARKEDFLNYLKSKGIIL